MSQTCCGPQTVVFWPGQNYDRFVIQHHFVVFGAEKADLPNNPIKTVLDLAEDIFCLLEDFLENLDCQFRRLAPTRDNASQFLN